MKGMNKQHGTPLAGVSHLRQSIQDILTTPIGTRVMRRSYGSRIYDLIDTPINNITVIEVFMAVAEALKKWEPRYRLQQVRVVNAQQGQLVISLTGFYVPEGRIVDLDGLIL